MPDDNAGYIFLWRKIRDDWRWENPEWLRAWLWLLTEAIWEPEGRDGLNRGQLRLSLQEMMRDCQMTERQVRYFLDRCIEHGDILWSKGLGGRPGTKTGKNVRVFVRDNVRVFVRDSGIVTIYKYGDYQTSSGNGVRDNVRVFVRDNVKLSGKSSYQEQERTTTKTGASSDARQRRVARIGDWVFTGKFAEGDLVEDKPDEPKTQEKSSKKKSKQENETNPAIKKLIDFYHDEYLKAFKKKPVIIGGREANTIKRLLSVRSEEEIRRLLLLFLEDDLSWMRKKTTHSIGLFETIAMRYDDEPEQDDGKWSTNKKLDGAIF